MSCFVNPYRFGSGGGGGAEGIAEALGTGTLMIPIGATGDWDDGGLREFGNLLEDPSDTGKEYKMAYSGYTGTQIGTNVFVGAAYSSDGITWTKYDSASPIIARASEDPYIVKSGIIYYLYAEDKADNPFRNIRLYTSTDFATWTDQGDVLDIGDPGSWEDTDVSSPVVWIDGSTWHMLYEGRSSTQRGAIGHATSSDGLSWVKDPLNPIFVATNSEWGYAGVSWCDALVPDQITFRDDGLVVLNFHGRIGDDTQFVPGIGAGRDIYSFEDVLGDQVGGEVGDSDLQPLPIFDPMQWAYVVIAEGIYRAAATAPLASLPSFTVDPAISQPNGFIGVGDTLTVTPGTSDGFAPRYQWKRDGAEIADATGLTYTLTAEDEGASITCTETVVNSAGATSATSNSLGLVVSPSFATQTRTLSDSSNRTLSDTTDRTISNRTA
jgi:hypothetical protein